MVANYDYSPIASFIKWPQIINRPTGIAKDAPYEGIILEISKEKLMGYHQMIVPNSRI